MDYIAFGKRVRNRRRELTWRQEDLAKAANISTSFLGHIERASRVPSLETLMKLSSVMCITTDELLQDSLLYTNHQGSIETRKIKQLYNCLLKILPDLERITSEIV